MYRIFVTLMVMLGISAAVARPESVVQAGVYGKYRCIDSGSLPVFKGTSIELKSESQGMSVTVSRSQGKDSVKTPARLFIQASQYLYREPHKASHVLFRHKNPFLGDPLAWIVHKGSVLELYEFTLSQNGSFLLKKFDFDQVKKTFKSASFGKRFSETASKASVTKICSFVGNYAGKVQSPRGGLPRDSKLRLKSRNDGFSIKWVTSIPDDSGRNVAPRYKTKSIRFRKSALPGIYQEDTRISIFKKAKKRNFFSGDPLIWSMMVNGVLYTINMALHDLKCHIQIYERTLLENKDLKLLFTSIIDGKKKFQVSGLLKYMDE